jgi:hypothetical protein
MLLCSSVYIYRFGRIYGLHLHASFVNDMPDCMALHISKKEKVEASNLTLFRERSYCKMAINEISLSVIITCLTDTLTRFILSINSLEHN